VVSSADALEFESLSTQIILDWIGLDWIVLHTNENTESMVKGRIDPSALPNSRWINPISVIMWKTHCVREKWSLRWWKGGK
jgi:hypothetical protein